MVWYADGSIQVEANGQVATGTGTAFLKNVRIGDGLTIAGSASMHEVTNIASDTQLTFSPPFTGAAGAGKQYRIAPIQGYVKEAADLLRALTQNLGTFANSPTLGALADLQGQAGRVPRFTGPGAMELAEINDFTHESKSKLDNLPSPSQLDQALLNKLSVIETSHSGRAGVYDPVIADPGGELAYKGALVIRETGGVQDGQGFAKWVRPAISFVWASQYVKRLSMDQLGKLCWDDDPLLGLSSIERGGNANGDYIRFPDGTMICHGFIVTGTIEAAGWIDIALTFPASFLNAALYCPSAAVQPYANWSLGTGMSGVHSTSPNGCVIRLGTNGATPQQFEARWQAIGRWK